MSIDMNKAIEYMSGMKNRGVTYSMYGSRTGTDGTADCSGAVYKSLIEAGATIMSYVPSTETLHNWLLENGFELYAENTDFTPKRGDVFIWGRKGESAGAGGHTGIFYDDNEQIIHCNYGYNGVTINDYNTISSASGYPYSYVYCLKENRKKREVHPAPPVPPAPKPTKRRYGYRVDDLQFVNGLWQVRNDVLGQPDFDWTENGINVAYIDKINPATGENTPDQELKVGDYFSFQPSSVGIITEQHSLNGKTISHVQFPDEFIWLYTKSVEKLIYG